jgi:hypothetical protein
VHILARKEFTRPHPDVGADPLGSGEINQGPVAEEDLAAWADDHCELRHGIDDGSELFILGEETVTAGEFIVI